MVSRLFIPFIRWKQQLPDGEGSHVDDNRRDYKLIGSVRENRWKLLTTQEGERNKPDARF